MMDTNRAAPSDTPTPPNTTHCCNDLLPGVHLALVSCSYHPLCRNDRSSKNGYICQNDGIMSRFPLISTVYLEEGLCNGRTLLPTPLNMIYCCKDQVAGIRLA